MKPATKAETAHMAKVAAYGCIICRWFMGGIRSEAHVHHMLTKGGKRMGHFYTLGLCPSHHEGHGVTNAMRRVGIVPRSDSQRTFEKAYGMTEAQMLERLQKELK